MSTPLLRPCALRGAAFAPQRTPGVPHAATNGAVPSALPNSATVNTHAAGASPALVAAAPHSARPTPLHQASDSLSTSQPAAPCHHVHTTQLPPIDRRDFLMLSSSLVLSHMASLAAATRPALAADTGAASSSNSSQQQRGLAKYIRRKQLDPLETYVPLVLDAQQVLALSKQLALAGDATAARELLRQGPYNGLRDNIRAIGEYAAQGATDKAGAAALVSTFFTSLEVYDRLLFVAIRDKAAPEQAAVEAQVKVVDDAFGGLLATVPDATLARAREVLGQVQAKAAAAANVEDPAVSDSELVQLLR